MQVTVTNIKSGKVSNGLSFRYGVAMFISSFSPMEGPADTPTTVTIFGQGFVAPVSVEIAGISVPQWDVLSVAGTEIVARSKPIPESARDCGDTGGAITVINIGSNTKATSTQSFTYRASRPLITSVQVGGAGNTVTKCGDLCPVCSGLPTVTVHGSGFQSGMTATLESSVGGGVAGPVVTTFIDANTLRFTLPDLTDIDLGSVGCTISGTSGLLYVPTGVGLTIRNPRNDCSDKLRAAIVMNPCSAISVCIPSYTVLITVSPAGGGSVSSVPGGVGCAGAVCTGHFISGTISTLIASPSAGFTFGSWGGDCLSCSTDVCTGIAITGDVTCSVAFSPVPTPAPGP
jgi:hypothetical protein